MERLKAFWAEYCDFSYNTVAETYECRARKLQHDFVEIDRPITIYLSSYPELNYLSSF